MRIIFIEQGLYGLFLSTIVSNFSKVLNNILSLSSYSDDPNESNDFKNELDEAAGSFKPLSEVEKRKRDREVFEEWKKKLLSNEASNDGKERKMVQTKLNFKKIGEENDEGNLLIKESIILKEEEELIGTGGIKKKRKTKETN